MSSFSGKRKEIRFSSFENAIYTTLQEGGSIDRDTISLLAGAYYVSDLKSSAEKALRLCARKYAATYLRAYFELVPWDSQAIHQKDQFKRLYTFVADQTGSFKSVTKDTIEKILVQKPCAILIFRLILGYSPDEIELILGTKYGLRFGKDRIREIEQRGEGANKSSLRLWRSQVAPKLAEFIYNAALGQAFVKVEGIDEGLFKQRAAVLNVDPTKGWVAVAEMANRGIPFYELLYQRYIGGAVRQALDMSSAIKADILEGPLSTFLKRYLIPFYKTGPRERIEGWEQAPDFLIPDKDNPELIIEAKVAEDGGTARDKASRIERLARFAHSKGIICIAIIDGKGFRRINDVLVPILINCRGKVFSYSNLSELLTLPEIAKWIGKS